MKKVLIVTYHFPPSNAVGALRPAKFAEYLPEFGWEPVVLTAPPEGTGNGMWQFELDAGVRREVVRGWPGLRQVAQRIASGRGSAAPAGGGAGQAESDASASTSEATWRSDYEKGEGRTRKLKDLLYSLMWLPDDRQGWIPPTVARGLALIRRERPDALLTTSPPHSGQVVGLVLAKLTGVPLIADFRDPWIGNPETPAFIRSGPTPRVHELLEGQTVDAASFVVTATRSHARALARRWPSAASKIRCIPNGFDAASFAGLESKPDPSGRFTITYTGNFYHTRTPRPLFEAVALLIQEDGLDPSRLRINLVGDCEHAGPSSVREMARMSGCEAALSLPGRMPYRNALAELVGSNLLLLLAAGQPDQIPAKTYEYIAAGPPILALIEPGATAELLSEGAEADILFEPDPRRIAAVLRRRLENGRSAPAGRWTPPAGAGAYTRRSGARRLVELLDAAAA